MSDNLNKYGLSRSIPEGIKRQVRQACGFGCVCCGLAIASYEHIDPEFHEAKSHDPDRMAFLCEGCHSRITRNFWSKQRVKEARESPWCIQEGSCHDAFDTGDNNLTVWVGGNRIVNMETILKVDDTALLSIEPPEASGGPYRLSGEFYDERGALIAGSGGALRIGDGGGTFTIGALPKPSDLPKTLKGKSIARHWGTIRFIVPEKSKSVGRNEPCPCQSGLKYKKCCGN